MKREAVSLLGLAALLFALVFPALTAKPNRAAEGVSVSLWTTPTPEIAVVGLLLVAAIVAAMVLTLVPSRRRLGALRLSVSVAFIPLLLALLGIGSAVALERSGFDAGRTGPGLGWWLGALGAYVLFYDARRRLARNGGATASASGSADHGAVLVRLATPVVLLATVAVFLLVPFDGIGVVQEFLNRGERFWGELGAHLVLSGASVAGAVVIGVPLGMWAFRSKRAVRPVFTVTSGLQTIPSLALFGLMIAPLAFLSREIPALRAIGIRGVGNAPAIIALTLYGLLPVVRNTFVGLKSIDPGIVEAGRGMGMSRGELLRMVQIPIALPIILTGLRITAVQTVGNAAVAALIGARGLGNFVFQGLGQAAPDLIVLGALPIVALAVIVDRGMDMLIRALQPGPEEERS